MFGPFSLQRRWPCGGNETLNNCERGATPLRAYYLDYQLDEAAQRPWNARYYDHPTTSTNHHSKLDKNNVQRNCSCIRVDHIGFLIKGSVGTLRNQSTTTRAARIFAKPSLSEIASELSGLHRSITSTPAGGRCSADLDCTHRPVAVQLTLACCMQHARFRSIATRQRDSLGSNKRQH